MITKYAKEYQEMDKTNMTINEIWNKPEDIQAHIERASKAPHFERFLAVNLEFATMSIMGEKMFELN